ncbi:MAG: ABC transporter ATP-binding protein, partial [bacterium]
MLDVRDLHAYYGKSHILQGVDMRVAPGEIVALLGRNGAGRSTMIKAIMGAIAVRGTVLFRQRDITGWKPHLVCRQGIGYVPESRDIFPGLSVRQNLLLGCRGGRTRGRWSIDDVFARFPNLSARADVPAGELSGGEQQMLTMCRTLMG